MDNNKGHILIKRIFAIETGDLLDSVKIHFQNNGISHV